MTYKQLYDKANSLLDHNKITLGEYEEMIKPLEHEVPHWIPCSERLPEYGEEVITINRDDEYEINHIIDDEDGEWFWHGAIAWQPLPEPYHADCN